MPDTSDLYTTVKNKAGVSRTFGYLGRHGRTLDANETLTIYGNLQDQPGWNKRKQQSYERDLLAGRIELLNTPRVVLKDTAPDAAIANPTVQATAATSTGGSLAVGYYKFAYTFVSAWGESTVGTSLSAALQIPDATNDRAVITTPAPNGTTNATAINIYSTAMAASGGAVDATTLRKVGQITGATTTFNLDTLPAVDADHPAPPTSNTTDAAEVMGLKLTDNTLGTVDPSWGRYTE